MAYYFHPDLGLVMAGGQTDYPANTAAVERTTDGQEFLSVPPLPAASSRQCMVITDGGVVYVTGGYRGGEEGEVSRTIALLISEVQT